MTKTISNSEDILDSRDIIARLEELQGEHKDLFDDAERTAKDYKNARGKQKRLDAKEDADDASNLLGEWIADNGAELKALTALVEEAEGSPDWKYGETLIRASYFRTHAQELAEETGGMDTEAASRWPFTCIDWDQAAAELQMDYTSVEFDGVTYYIRS